MPFTIVRNDIIKMDVDAIVNAANTELQMGGGVCGAIFKAAGADKLQAACDKLAPIKTGEAVITPGFALSAKYVIHAAGPVYHRWNADKSEQYLRSAYINSLKRATENDCESIAFPLISSGIYGYPKEEALKVATSAIQDFLTDHDIDVFIVVFDKAAFVISEKLLGEVSSYIDEHYVVEREITRNRQFQVDEFTFYDETIEILKKARPSYLGIEYLIENLDEPFSQTLLRLIDAKGKTDVEIYKRANFDRKLFSKIRTVKGYIPSKKTVLALAVALELTLPETDDLLERAGYAFSHSRKFDVIIEYFIKNGKYDIFEINEVLFNYDQPLLGGFIK